MFLVSALLLMGSFLLKPDGRVSDYNFFYQAA